MYTIGLRVKMYLGGAAIISLLALAFILMTAPKTYALSGSEFDAGRIIDDAVFYNKDALNPNQIQQFLNAKVPSCDTNGSIGPYYDRNGSRWNTRADYGRANNAPPPYTCLKSYSQSVPNVINSGSDLCGGSIFAGTKSAAQIIYDVSQACGVNPQTLLVLLQKEQALVTDDWPWPIQYRSATGYGCPDTAPCDSEYYGFFNQVYQAAKAYKRYQANPAGFNYRAGRNNTIYWHPNAGCGTSSVYIVNQATAGLYTYTPYRPNQAALNNLYGTGDGCSSYGNRNFWRLFVEWFGSVRDSYVSLDTPRWMVLNKDQRKMIPGTNSVSPDPADTTIPSGTQIKFVSKLWADGRWYLRTAYDTSTGISKGIPASSVSDIPFQPLDTPRWMKLGQSINKVNPRSGNTYGAKFAAGLNVKIIDKIYVNGMWYFRTQFDANAGSVLAFPANNVTETDYIDFETPRYLEVSETSNKQNPILSQASAEQLTAGQQLRFSKKIQLGNDLFCQTEADAQAHSSLSVNCATTKEISYSGLVNGQPNRWMVLNNSTFKVQPSTEESGTSTFNAGLQVEFAQTITVNGLQYLRTKFDMDNDHDLAIAASKVSEIDFLAFENPRVLRLKSTTSKLNPKTGKLESNSLSKGLVINFATKILVNNKWYFRTAYDTANNNELAIPADLLTETNN